MLSLLAVVCAAAAADPAGMQLALAKCSGDASQQFTFALVAPYLNPAAVKSNLGVCLGECYNFMQSLKLQSLREVGGVAPGKISDSWCTPEPIFRCG